MVAKVRFWLFRKFKIDCQGFIFGYDIEITIPMFFVYDEAVFYEEGNTVKTRE